MSLFKIRFNLQLFAEDLGTGEPGLDPGTGAADPVSSEGAEPTPEAGAEAQGKDKDPSKAFAARLGHERKKMEAEYAPYRSVIETQAKNAGMEPGEYLKYLQEQSEREALEAEADKTGKTPEQIRAERKAAEAESRLAEVERKERLAAEEKELTGDPKIGKFVQENLEKIKEISEAAGVDLKVGLAMVVTEKLPDLLELTKPDIHIKSYLESIKAGEKPIEIGGGATAPSATPPRTFEDARKAAIEKLRR